MNKLDKFKTAFSELRSFTFLWLTQALSGLGSSMTSFALIIRIYGQEGSAMSAALLSVCSYAPYVLVSVFAGAISDKWNKKITMLVCDAFAAVSTVITLILLMTGNLRVWHLYLLNAVNGLMNSVQQPASDVAVSLLIPQKYYQQAAGMRVFSNSVINILTPAAASAVMSAFGINAVFAVDLATFFIAFISLLFFIRIPEKQSEHRSGESVTALAKEVFAFFKDNKGIFGLIMFLAAINLTASICNAALPALIIPKANDTCLCDIQFCTGHSNACRKCRRIAGTCAKKPDQSNIYFPFHFNEHGKLYAGIRQITSCMVHRSNTGLAAYPAYEHQP